MTELTPRVQPATVGQRLAGRIAAQGPIPVSEFVEACLYDPDGGFYMRGGRAGGRSGHFLTAPEVGPLFGAVLARALDAWWWELGRPEPFWVVDWGAGPGTLARSVLAAEPACVSSGALACVAVEVSEAQRSLHPEHAQVTSVARLREALPDGADAGVVVANELLDNLPFDIVERRASGWHELRVGIDSALGATLEIPRPAEESCEPRVGIGAMGGTMGGSGHESRHWSGGFSLVAAPAPPEMVDGLPDAAVGARVPVQRAARDWVAEAHRVLRNGRIVVFDYGADTATLARRSLPGHDDAAGFGWLRTLRGHDHAAGLGWLRTHRGHDHAASWLTDPGACDITVDVAWDQVQADRRAEACTQAEFLCRHGIEKLVAQGRAAWSERAAAGDLDAMRYRSRVREAEALMDPAGMGAFNVLVWTVR